MSFFAVKSSGSRLISIGIFVGLPAVLLAVSALNLLQVGDDRFAIAERKNQLSALEKRLASKAADGRPLDLTPIYIGGATRTLASANLQQHLVNAIAGASGTLVETASIEPDAAQEEANADEIRMKATLDIDNAGFIKLLLALEGGLPVLTIDTLSVRRLPLADEADSARLRIDVAVRGSWRQEGS